LGVGVGACGAERDRDLPTRAQTRDSLDIEIVETNGQRARSPSGIIVEGAPALQIGEVDGEAPFLFSSISLSGVALLPGDRILVVDRGSAELRFFDLLGNFIESWGGHGEGPGEFQQPRFLHTVAGDSIAIWDQVARRITIFPSDSEEGLGTVPGGRVGAAQGTSGSHVLQSAAAGVLRFNPSFGDHETLPMTTNLVLIDPAQGTEEILATTEALMVRIRTTNGVPLGTSPPYRFLRAYAADRDGFYITTPEGPHLLAYAWDGRLRRIIRILEPVNDVTEAEFGAEIDRRAEAAAERGSLTVQAYRSAFDEIAHPEIEPAFEELLVDDQGWVWARAFQEGPDESLTWLVFDANGEGRGSVEMPEGLSVHAISRDYVAGVWQDELDVEHVRLHRIDGRSR
jgi:hypothetical protein